MILETTKMVIVITNKYCRSLSVDIDIPLSDRVVNLKGKTQHRDRFDRFVLSPRSTREIENKSIEQLSLIHVWCMNLQTFCYGDKHRRARIVLLIREVYNINYFYV